MLGQRHKRWASIAGSVDKSHCVSHISVVPKRNNKFRLIQNLRPVSEVNDGKVTFQCEDIKTVAKLIDPKDNLVTVDIKTGSTTSKYIVSTVHRSHLITLITKFIDTTSISYQHLWLCCRRGDFSSFFYKKL